MIDLHTFICKHLQYKIYIYIYIYIYTDFINNHRHVSSLGIYLKGYFEVFQILSSSKLVCHMRENMLRG